MSILSLFLAIGCTPATSDVVTAPSSPAPAAPTVPATSGEGPTATAPGSESPTDPGTSVTEEPAETEEPTEPEEPIEDPCPPGVICLDTFPWVDRNDTTGGSSHYDAYGCSPSTDESGPEVVYRLDLPEDGLLALELENLPSGVDVDVHLLASDDAGDCIDRGHWAAGSLLEAGQYWVVVDSWVSSGGTVYSGAYDLLIGHTSAPDLELAGLDPLMAEDALLAFDQALWYDEVDRFEYVLIDFYRLATEPRLWVYDLATEQTLWHELTTHGEASSDPGDVNVTASFSNITDSHQSSLGVMRTAETYIGGNGYSMRYDGLEPGFNDNVRSRYIVMHPGSYATQDFVDDYGYLGESWGCTVLDPDINEALIDDVKDGNLVLAWYPDAQWRSESDYLQ